MDCNAQADQRRDPVGRKVIAVKVGKTEGGDLGCSHPRAVETLGESARSDAGVDEQDPGRRA
jgi:hypothetical protein